MFTSQRQTAELATQQGPISHLDMGVTVMYRMVHVRRHHSSSFEDMFGRMLKIVGVT